MSTRLMTPSEAEKYLKRIAEQNALVPPYRTANKTPRNPQSGRTVQTTAWRQDGWVVIQLGMFLASQRRVHWSEEKEARDKLDTAVWTSLVQHLPTLDRTRIEALKIVRLSPLAIARFDNLPWNLKGVLDRVCAWIACGNRVITFDKAERQKVGKYDDDLIRTKERPGNPIRYRVDQEPCGQKAGVQIWLKIRPTGRRSIAFMTPIALRRRKRRRVFRPTAGDPNYERRSQVRSRS